MTAKIPRNIWALAALLATFPAGMAKAQSDAAAAFPSRTITILVPFAAGGPPDVVARVIAPLMSEALGKPVVIENRPGASTTIVHHAVARADADGHTLMALDPSHTVVPHILAKPGFEPLKDYKYIALTAQSVLTVVIDPKLPIKNAVELVAYAKQNPGDLKAGHTGAGTPPHLGLVGLTEPTGMTVTQVVYKGAAIAINDVVGGHISMLVTAPSTSAQLHLSGRARVVGVTGAKRLSSLPDVPTLKEQGIETPSLDSGVWFGLAAPAGTADAIIAKLNAATNKAVQDKGAIATLAKTDIFMTGGSVQDCENLVRTQLGVWRDLMKKAGVKPE